MDGFVCIVSRQCVKHQLSINNIVKQHGHVHIIHVQVRYCGFKQSTKTSQRTLSRWNSTFREKILRMLAFQH